jgi:GNAT superfamily N-acetyltransferase
VAAAGAAGSRWHPEAAPRFKAGQVCAVACHGKEVVSYCWLTGAPTGVTEIDRLVVPGPDDVYLYDAFTEPRWRGRALFSATLLQLLSFARAQGKRRALIFVLTDNHASRKAIERTGFELFLAVSKITWWGWSRLWFRGGRKRHSQVTLVRRV